jgi:hypothetical protein
MVTPANNAKSGVKEFKIPVTELLIFVCAKANKNGGIALPNIADKKTKGSFPFGILKPIKGTMGSNDKKAINILKAPT